jgi:Holliday junction DNA helicase RuvB
VFYVPMYRGQPPVLLYRLVEVKFGPRKKQWSKAQQQLSETAQKLIQKFPFGRWREERSPTALLLERDIAWTLHEALERYRAFGLLPEDHDMEAQWNLKELFKCLHRGDFELRPYGAAAAAWPHSPVNGTALMLDPEIPGTELDVSLEKATEYLTIPQDLIAQLLTNQVGRVVHDAPDPNGSEPGPPSPVGTSLSTSDNRGEGVETVTAPSRRTPEGVDAPPRGANMAGEVSSSDRADEPRSAPEAVLVASAQANGGHTAHEAGVRDRSTEADHIREQALLRVDQIFEGFVGNSGPVTRLKRALTIASIEEKRWLEPIGLFGPKSTGKTELARRIARALDLPKAELSETLLRSADDLAAKIQQTAEDAGTPMRMDVDEDGATILRAPPMVVFIDEVHLLKARVQESLLKALEPDDRTLLSSRGTINTRQVTFIIATTDPGDLGDAFKSRIARFELREYTIEELVQILEAHRERHSDIPPEASQFNEECLRIFARVGRLVPRQALRLMRDAARELRAGFMQSGAESLRRHYWDLYRADGLGLTDRDRAYLRVLFPDHVAGIDALAAQLGVGKSTISADIEPYLLRLGLVERRRGGRSLSRRGREEVPKLAE